MGERVWTEKQSLAIDNRDRTLLVSAAAGSGKTATLTERIIRQLMDENNAVSVEELLVVTFTNAAAAELRAKITAALEEAVKSNPKNQRLGRQLFMLPQAKIRTIDSFCGDILRANADRVGVPFNYRIADEAECELIGEAIMGGLIEAVYCGSEPSIATPEEFEELADCLTDSKRTQELSDVLRLIYARCECSEEGVGLIDKLSELYKAESYPSLESTPHNAYLLERTREMAKHYLDLAEELCARFGASDGEAKYRECALSDIAVMKRIYFAADYESAREAILSFELVRRPSVRKDKTIAMELYGKVRDRFKKDVNDDFKPLFTYRAEEWMTLLSRLYQKNQILYKFLSRYDELFVREKLRRGALSYADVERFTYECLISDGKPTEVAENLARSFSAIYIDEYQDVNALQNSIFEAISRPDNRFMVGDIKQSIYGFRHAKPEIFAQMKRTFTPIEKAAGGESSSIFMSNNFRCDKAIVDFVNEVFDKAFTLIGDSIGYVKEDRLVYSKKYDTEPEYHTPEICMLEKGARESDSDGTECLDAPAVVARKIKAILKDGRLADGSAPRPSDIAIILRNARGKDTRYAEALEKEGIPVKISGAKSFFLCAEVLLALCLLNSIDNPRRDIYLAGLMCSPLYSFTPDELYLIRRANKESCLYDALNDYCAENPEFEKGQKFLAALRKYRAISEGVPCDELLFRLYRETGLLALASKSGGKENLMILYDYSRQFEAGEFKGLYNFIHFVNSLIDKRTTFDDSRESSEEEAVRIVTCHASKGLEYPIVFLVDAGVPFGNKDARGGVAYNGEMGIAMRLRTPMGLALVNNPVFDIINQYNFRKSYEEELRILYVALTRARERLYVVGTSPLADSVKYAEEIECLRETLSPYGMRNLRSYLEIILVTTGKKPLCAEEFSGKSEEAPEEEAKPAEQTESAPEKKDTRHMERLLSERFEFVYPHKALTRLPEKMSVSKTSPTVLDYADEGVIELSDEGEESGRTYLPRFISGSRAEESARRGIATHYFLQFCDLGRLKAQGPERELQRLVSEGYISKADGERVRLDELSRFCESPLFYEMLEAKELHRELRFNVRLPAEHFTTDKELLSAYRGKEVLVQGVIDCIIVGNDGSVGLYDYKTDRLSREELADKELGREALRKKHKTQLSYYALAVERIFGKSPEKVGIYSLHLGETVYVDK